MRKLLKNKVKSKRGFTLAEMLLAILILLMVSAIVATGIPAAKNAYEKVVLASNADLLLSTTITSLRNELGTATDISISNGTTVSYYNETRESKSEISLGNSPTTIMLQRYVKDGDFGIDSDKVRLVSKTASTGDLYVTYDSVVYNNDVVKFTNLSVNRESGTTGLATRASLSIPVISQ